MEQQITCINCPVGCRLQVVLENGQVVSVSGNSCKRGETYAKQECTAPTRMVTAAVPLQIRKSPGAGQSGAECARPYGRRDLPRCVRHRRGCDRYPDGGVIQIDLSKSCEESRSFFDIKVIFLRKNTNNI